MVIKMLSIKKLQDGFTLIELIASMVLMAIMLPSVGLLVVNSMRAISTHNVSLQANVDAGFVQNNFTKHLDALSSFSDDPDPTSTSLKFTIDNGTEYVYTIDSDDRDIKYSRKIGAGSTYSGKLMKKVLVDSTDDDFDSKFIYRDINNVIIATPGDTTIKSVELKFTLSRAKQVHRYSVYVMPDQKAHDNETNITL
jgi:prepilin-type N-terminal cleavage/methylation domain-containing protein